MYSNEYTNLSCYRLNSLEEECPYRDLFRSWYYDQGCKHRYDHSQNSGNNFN